MTAKASPVRNRVFMKFKLLIQVFDDGTQIGFKPTLGFARNPRKYFSLRKGIPAIGISFNVNGFGWN